MVLPLVRSLMSMDVHVHHQAQHLASLVEVPKVVMLTDVRDLLIRVQGELRARVLFQVGPWLCLIQ